MNRRRRLEGMRQERGLAAHSLIPTSDASASSQHLSDRNTLLLPSGDTTNLGVTHESVPHMPQTEDSDEDISERLPEVLARLIEAGTGRASTGGELDGLLDSEGREVDIVFGRVLNVASEVLLEFGRGERIVVNVAGHRAVLFPMVGESLEQSAAASAWASENN